LSRINGDLWRSDARGMRVEARPDHPQTCAARGLEHTATVVVLRD
jgi:hypothetical protein